MSEELVKRLVEKHVVGSDAFKADALRFGNIVSDAVSEALAARIAQLEAERDAAREVLQVFVGDAAIEAKRLFERMMATPRHTPKRKELAALHYEAAKRAALARALKDTRDD